MMKRSTFSLSLLLLGVLIYSCSPKLDRSTSSLQLTEKLSNLAANWKQLLADAPMQNDTRIPELGVRGRYQSAKSVLGKNLVETITGEQVYLSGPHDKSINYYSATDFGRYNPKFLTKLQSILSNIYSNQAFVSNFQAFYDQELKQYLRTYHLSYEAGTTNEEVRAGYLTRIAQPENYPTSGADYPSFYLQEAFRGFGDSLEGQGYDWYESTTCPGFWIRRSIDGTADKFYELLNLTIKTFDPSFLDY